jgi:hypothetical protein
MRMAGRALSPVRWISRAHGMAAGNFAIALVSVAQGRQEEVGSGYREVVELRVEGIKGRWPMGGESSQRVGAARAATVAGGGAVCARATEEEGHLNRWLACWERWFVNA